MYNNNHINRFCTEYESLILPKKIRFRSTFQLDIQCCIEKSYQEGGGACWNKGRQIFTNKITCNELQHTSLSSTKKDIRQINMTTAAERKYIRELMWISWFFTTAILIIREMEENNPAHACNKKIQTNVMLNCSSQSRWPQGDFISTIMYSLMLYM